MVELSADRAAALFDLALENGMLSEFLEQAVFVRDAMQSVESVNILENPLVTDEDKRKFLNDVFAGKIHDDLYGFLYLLVTTKNESLIVPSLSSFINMVRLYGGKAQALVVSAAPLDDNQIAELSKLLSKKLSKNVEITATVDESLLGGLYIHVDGRLIDRTVKKQLNDLKDKIKIEL